MELDLEQQLMELSKREGLNPSIIERALLIAKKAHCSKKRATGEPFINHPLRVALRIASSNIKEKEPLIIIALLHDVLEEVEENYREPLEREIHVTFGKEIFERVLLLTREEGEDYFEYLDRVKKDKLAAIVKYFDVLDNLQSLPSNWSKEKIEKKLKEWKTALRVLGELREELE